MDMLLKPVLLKTTHFTTRGRVGKPAAAAADPIRGHRLKFYIKYAQDWAMVGYFDVFYTVIVQEFDRIISTMRVVRI